MTKRPLDRAPATFRARSGKATLIAHSTSGHFIKMTLPSIFGNGLISYGRDAAVPADHVGVPAAELRVRVVIPFEQSSYRNEGFLMLGEIVSGAESGHAARGSTESEYVLAGCLFTQGRNKGKKACFSDVHESCF